MDYSKLVQCSGLYTRNFWEYISNSGMRQ